VTKVGRIPGFHTLVEKNVGHGICYAFALLRPPAALARVRCREWPNLEVRQFECFPRLDMPDGRQLAEMPPFRLVRPRGEIDRYPVTPGKNARAPDMIGVLVGDQDPGQVANIGADCRDAPLEF